MIATLPRVLLWAAAAHGLVAILCVVALAFEVPLVMGVHPALKPLKFAVSIALFLVTMGVLLPSLSVREASRAVMAWLLAATMTIEMGGILAQALRGRTSHFNSGDLLDATIWNAMVAAIVVTTVVMLWLALASLVGPLVDSAGHALPPLLATAWRAGLLLLLLAPVSGFAMGGRLAHSVGGEDGGAGLPLLNWSVSHGDLRVAHFFALHAVQVLPLSAWLLLQVPLVSGARATLLFVAIGVASTLSLGTLLQALAGRPVWRNRRASPPVIESREVAPEAAPSRSRGTRDVARSESS